MRKHRKHIRMGNKGEPQASSPAEPQQVADDALLLPPPCIPCKRTSCHVMGRQVAEVQVVRCHAVKAVAVRTAQKQQRVVLGVRKACRAVSTSVLLHGPYPVQASLEVEQAVE